MADTKISALTELAQVDVATTTDFLTIVDTTAGATKKVTPENLVSAVFDAGQSLAADGYVTLPGGLIIQWGSNEAATLAGTAITFPLAFPSSVYSIAMTPRNAGTLYKFGHSASSTTGFTATADANVNFDYIAIGK